jgi:hypothetical protein
LIAGTGISLSSATGAVTITNTGSGSVTSVGIASSIPTILTVTGTNPITTSGTITLSLNAELAGLAGLSTNGFVQRTGVGTYISTALTSSQVTTAVPDVSSFFNDAGYLTGNQNITVTGDVSGHGTNAITLTLALSGVAAGTYGTTTSIPQLVINTKGLITHAANLAIPTFTGSTPGLVPTSPGGTAKSLLANGTWGIPSSSSSLIANGYIEYPNGLIENWGEVSTSPSSPMTVTFSKAYTTRVFSVTVTPTNVFQEWWVGYPYSSLTGFTLGFGAGSVTNAFSWRAIGY